MQGEVTVSLENRKLVYHEGDSFTIPPYAVHSVCQGREARLLSVCIGTAFVAETDLGTADVIVRELLDDIVVQGILGEVKEKLMTSIQAVFHVRDRGGKEMDTFELFSNGKLVVPEKETDFGEIQFPFGTDCTRLQD